MYVSVLCTIQVTLTEEVHMYNAKRRHFSHSPHAIINVSKSSIPLVTLYYANKHKNIIAYWTHILKSCNKHYDSSVQEGSLTLSLGEDSLLRRDSSAAKKENTDMITGTKED